jgi:protein-S-isoprenylcysteine O-methyltransferase Ste14
MESTPTASSTLSPPGNGRIPPAIAARVAAGLVVYVALFAALLFLPAGTLRWPRAWVALGVMAVLRAIAAVRALRVNPELMAERTGLPIREGQPMLDRVLVSTFMASFAAQIAFCSADVFHLRLLPRPPLALSLAGLLLFAAGWWIAGLTVKVNAFAAVAVRHQEERRHTVVDTGVYAVVRHPMYAGTAAVMVGMGLWLGSYAGALLALVPIALLAARIVLEERFLRRTLAGYDDYTRRVRWRLVPGLW